jgi:hypothetical protein
MTEPVTQLGVIIFPGFAVLDVACPMQFFNQLSDELPFKLSIIAKAMDPVNTALSKSSGIKNQISRDW